MRYHYMIDNVQVPKVRIGGGGKKTAVAPPELLDQNKTRISYMISTFRPFRQLIMQRPFKDVQRFLTQDYKDRYRHIRFNQRWEELSKLEPEKVVSQIHADMQKHNFDLSLLQRLFQELDLEYLRAHK